MNILKQLKDQEGAIHLVEGAYIFPVVFFVIFFLVFLTFLFLGQIRDRENTNRALQTPISSAAFVHPDEEALKEKLGRGAHIEVHGLFFKELLFTGENSFWGGKAFRYFELPQQVRLVERQKIRWASSTENLRHYMAIMRWMKNKEAFSTKANP